MFPQSGTSSVPLGTGTGTGTAAAATPPAPVVRAPGRAPPEVRVLSAAPGAKPVPVVPAYGVASCIGSRPTMEDVHGATIGAVGVFGVYDGHCGRHVAEACAKGLPALLTAHPLLSTDPASAIADAFLQQDRRVYQTCGDTGGGSTAVVATVVGGDVYIAHLGDARAVVGFADGSAAQATIDHKPSVEAERKRVVAAGGFVEWDRVGGCLAVSRAFGDFEFKNGLMVDGAVLAVGNTPDIARVAATDSLSFLLLACDGVWDVVTTEMAAACVRSNLLPSAPPPPSGSGSGPGGISVSTGGAASRAAACGKAAAAIVQLALDRRTTDNVSAMVITLHD